MVIKIAHFTIWLLPFHLPWIHGGFLPCLNLPPFAIDNTLFPLPFVNFAVARHCCSQFSQSMASTSGLAEAMDFDGVEGYRPPPEFEDDVKEPLIDLSLTDSTELWLLQLPYAQACLFLL